jgi:flagellar basal body rod protein FlgB
LSRRSAVSDFRAALKESFAATESKEEATLRARIVDDTAAPRRADGNTVDVDLQMAKMSSNASDDMILARLLEDEFKDLRGAIEGR